HVHRYDDRGFSGNNFLMEGYRDGGESREAGCLEREGLHVLREGRRGLKVQRKQPGVPKGRPEKVADGGFEMDTNYIYFVDRDGDVARAKRAVGGQKRKKKTARAKKKKASARKVKKTTKTKVKAKGGAKKK